MVRRRRHSSAGPRSVLALGVATAFVISSCSFGSDASEPPPPATRDVTPITSSTVAPSPTLESAASPDDDALETPTTVPPEPLAYSIEWESAGDRVERGRLTVPLDYSDPTRDTIELEVVRHLAPESSRVGSLLVNRGGPGAASSDMGYSATRWFESPITDRFDIVAFDPRGTGLSGSSVDCIDDEDHDRYYANVDITPDDAGEREALIGLAEEFTAGCVERTDGLTYIGTTNSARDIDAIRQALGEDQVSWFGFSYGSLLGATWATMFPTTVRAAVFDGARDPSADPHEWSMQQRSAFEASLDRFLEDCASNSSCAFYNDGQPSAALDGLLEEIDESPIPTGDDRAPVTRSVATTALLQAMYSDAYWPTLERALEDAAAGSGAGLLALYDVYHQRDEAGGYPDLIESFQAITCMDREQRLSVEESDAQAAELRAVAPRLAPSDAGSYFCTFFPESAEPIIEISGVGAGPIVVIGTTGDPATPLESSRAMAEQLEDGRFVSVEADRHTAYGTGDCINGVVHRYLVQLEAPADGTAC